MRISREIRAAVIVIVIIICSIWGYNFLKGKNILKQSNEYYALFDRIDGVIVSSGVFIKGYKVGNVEAVEFDYKTSGKFIVKLAVDDAIELPNDTYLNIQTTNLIASSKDLELIIGTSTSTLEPGDTLVLKEVPSIMEKLDPITQQVDSILLQLNTTLGSLNQILAGESSSPLGASLANIESLTHSLDKTLKPGGDLHASLENIKGITDTLEANKEQLGTTLRNMATLSDSLAQADIKGTVDSLSTTVNELNMLLTGLNKGEGTAGMLLHDSTLYNNLSSSMASLDSLLIDLKEHPGRYVQVSVFGGKQKD